MDSKRTSVRCGSQEEGAKKLAASLTTRAKAKVARLDWLIDAGQFEEADELAPQIVKGLAGHAVLEEKA